MRACIVLAIVLAACQPAWAQESNADSLLDTLHRRDNASFPDSLFNFDRERSDSVLAVFDSLGFSAYEHELDLARPWFQWNLGLAKLGSYNRVEGSVGGLDLGLEFGRDRLVELDLEGWYSFAAEKVRYRGRGEVHLGKRSPWSVEGQYLELIQPFGSNRIVANSFWALIAGADNQDYLRRRGGDLSLNWRPEYDTHLWVGASRYQEFTAGVHRSFSVLGEMDSSNPPVSDGENAQVFAGIQWGSLWEGRHEGTVTHRVSSPDVGSDFDYSRTDLDVSLRDYVLGRHEVVLSLKGVNTSGSAPIQAMADVGGLSTVRGFSRRNFVGESSAAVRMEWLVPYDPLRAMKVPIIGKLRLQFVPWADAARVWGGNSENWLTSLGVGIQSYIGPFPQASQLRLDVAFPTGSSRPEDATLYLHFSAGDF